MRARLLVVALILASTLTLAQQSGGGGGPSGGGTGGIAGVSTAAGSGLSGGCSTGTCALTLITSCSSTQVLAWNGSAWACASGGGGDTITSPNTTITVGGTSSATTVEINLGNANTWTGTQTFGTIIPTTIGGSPNFSQTTGTAPFSVTSTTVVTNLNAGSLNGKTFVNPGPIGSTTPAAGTFTALTCGVAGTTSCVFTGAGSTSGTGTITWPAVAGTTSNPFVLSNAITTPQASLGAPTGGLEGTGTVNVSGGYYVNGVSQGNLCTVSACTVTGSSSSISTTTLYTPTVTGIYKVAMYLEQAAACETPGLTGSFALAIDWTDSIGAQEQTLPNGNIAWGTEAQGNLLITAGDPSAYEIKAIAGQPITYQTTYGVCTTGTATYNLTFTITPN